MGAMDDDARPTLEGARLLRNHLRKTGQSVPVFCERHKLDRIQVQRYLRGERRYAPVDFAYEIQTATGGDVPWYTWRSSTLGTGAQAA
jgi:hypothetical protein